jgi:hypothetical protein
MKNIIVITGASSGFGALAGTRSRHSMGRGLSRSRYFDTIPHHELTQSVAGRVSDGAMLALIKAWLEMAATSAAFSLVTALGEFCPPACSRRPERPPHRKLI